MSDCFDWAIPGLEAPRFRAITNLLSLRNGGQLDDPRIEDSDLNDDVDEYADVISEADTDHPARISDSGHEELKKKFLDRLAEITSREKPVSKGKVKHAKKKGNKAAPGENKVPGSFIACTCLQEYEERVEIHVTRNNGLDDKDQSFFKSFASCLTALASSRVEEYQSAKTELWNTLVSYSVKRTASYIACLKCGLDEIRRNSSSSKDFPRETTTFINSSKSFMDDESIGEYSEASHQKYMDFAREKFESFANQVFDAVRRETVTTDLHTSLIDLGITLYAI